jgi:predicted DNA-binding transcriptional regulator AlpA
MLADDTSTSATANVLLDSHEVAALLQCSVRHIHRLSAKGRIPPPIRLGGLVRWDRSVIEQWVAACSRQVGTPSKQQTRDERSSRTGSVEPCDEVKFGNGAMRQHKHKKRECVLAPIRADEIYSLQLLRAMTGWGDSAIRAARKSGLRSIYLHGRVFYHGCDLMDYINAAVGVLPSSARPGQDVTTSKEGLQDQSSDSERSPSYRGGAADGR